MGSSMTPRGGKREGAGRPPLYGENLKPVTVWLTVEQIEYFKRYGDISTTVREGMMSRIDRLRKIEELLGADGSPEAVQIMDEYLPDADWNQLQWDDALELTNQRMYHPGYVPDSELELRRYQVLCRPDSGALQTVLHLLEQNDPLGFDDDGNEVIEIATRRDIESRLNESSGVVKYWQIG